MPLKTLIEFGLSEKEAKIYLALLRLGVANVSTISKESGINRSSTYVVIEALRKKELVTLTTINKTVRGYIATSPEILFQMARDRSDISFNLQKKIEEMLPELRALHKETEHAPRVLVYEGDEAIKMSYYSTFGPEFRIYKDLTGMSEAVPNDYVEQDAHKRKKGNVKMLMISPDTKENREIVKKYQTHKSPDTFALIPPEKFSKSKSNRNIGIGIYRDRIKFASTKEKFAIYIVNQAITDTLRDLFDLAWAESKRLNIGEGI